MTEVYPTDGERVKDTGAGTLCEKGTMQIQGELFVNGYDEYCVCRQCRILIPTRNLDEHVLDHDLAQAVAERTVPAPRNVPFEYAPD